MAERLVVDLDSMRVAWPLGESMLEDLRWYLEDYLTVPFGVYEDRGGRVQARLAGWGRTVYTSVFGAAAVQRDAHLVLRSASPSLLALPWELMVAPGHALPLALEVAGMSRSLTTGDEAEAVPVPGGQLRVLTVISRPAGTSDVGYRIIARPLLKRLETVRGLVDLVVLRPPTLATLRAELQAAAAAGKPYQVVHFDGHGAIFDGEGRLVFERPDGHGHHVPAMEVAEILGGARVPVVVLNACQSGTVGKNLEAAVATALLTAGVASVVAMAYSVYSVAAAEFMTAFYNRLFGGGSVSSAVTAGRQQMFSQPGRPSPKGVLPLQDWLVPVHYLRRDASFLSARIIPSSPEEANPNPPGAEDDRAGAGDLDPADGMFIGRDASFYYLETTARRQRAVVLTGFGGTGKTELAKAFGRWWRDTDGVERPEWVFWHSFRPGHASFGLGEVIDEIGGRLFGAQFAALDGKERRRDQVLSFLTEHRALLIWDNFESVRSLPDPDGATPLLDEQGCAELRDFLARLAAHGKTAVLITSLTPEHWLGDIGRVPVLGLSRRDAAEYADHLLAPHPAARAQREKRSFGELMEWLDGHPLGMRLVLPRLEGADPAALLVELRQTLSAGDGAYAGTDPASSLEACIRYSYAHLAEQTRRLLPLTSLFQGVVGVVALLLASDNPDIPPRFAGASVGDWKSALDDARDAGLLTRAWASTDDEWFGLYLIHPALPGYLADIWRLDSPTDHDAVRKAATRALVGAHASICRQNRGDLDSEGGHQVFSRLDLEQENMGNFLGLALDNGMWAEANDIMKLLQRFWGARGLDAEYDTWTDRICAATQTTEGAAPLLGSPAGKLWWQVNNTWVLWKRSLGQVKQAERSYQKMLSAVAGQEPSPELDRCLARVYRSLGDMAQERGEPEEARQWYAEALTVEDRQGEAAEGGSSLRDLGNAALEQDDFATAEDFYRRSLAGHEEDGDQDAVAADYLLLGSAALKARRYKDAGVWFNRALTISRGTENLHDAALAFTALGATAAASESWDVAEEYLRRSVAVAGRLGSPPMLVQAAYIMLGSIARQRGRLAEADGWYRRLLGIREAAGNRREIADCYEHLGGVASGDGRLADAIDWYQKAFEIYQGLEDHPKVTEIRAEIDRMRPGEAGVRQSRVATGVRLGPSWAGLWHSVALRGAEFLDPGARQRGQADIAIAVAAADPDRAEQLAQSVTNGGWRAEALVGIAIAEAARDSERAERTALSLGDDFPKARALAGIAGTLAATDPGRSGRLAAQAEDIAQSMDGYGRAEGMVAVTAARAVRDPDRAEEIAQTLPAPNRARALAHVAATVAAAEPDRAIRLMSAAELAARSVDDDGWRTESLAGVAAALSAVDLECAERIAQSIELEESFGSSKAEALAVVATGFAAAQPDRAERIARSIGHEYLRDRTLAAIAATLAATDHASADRIARSIMHDGWRTEILSHL